MKFIGNNTIELDKEINELDRFVARFIRILKKHTEYVIVSGYISILFGRSRSTEDIDIFIKPIDKISFSRLYDDLLKNSFWCLNAESIEEVYSYLKQGISIRFAEKNQVIPNFEVKFAKRPLDFDSFNDCINVRMGVDEIRISSIERQIAFKRYYLKSDKDIEDAVYLEELFKNKINKGLIRKYKNIIENLK